MGLTPEDIEQRRNALALHKAMRAAEDAYQNSDEVYASDLPEEGQKEMDEIWAKHRDVLRAMHEEHDKAVEAIRAKYTGGSSLPLKAAWSTAEQAYCDATGDGILEDDNNNGVVCAKSGIPIYDTDEYIVDDVTGEHFLRSELGLPPRPDEEEEIEEAA